MVTVVGSLIAGLLIHHEHAKDNDNIQPLSTLDKAVMYGENRSSTSSIIPNDPLIPQETSSSLSSSTASSPSSSSSSNGKSMSASYYLTTRNVSIQ